GRREACANARQRLVSRRPQRDFPHRRRSHAASGLAALAGCLHRARKRTGELEGLAAGGTGHAWSACFSSSRGKGRLESEAADECACQIGRAWCREGGGVFGG